MARPVAQIREAVLVRHDLVFHTAQRQDQGADHASPVLSCRAVNEDWCRVAAGGEVAQDVLIGLSWVVCRGGRLEDVLLPGLYESLRLVSRDRI
jgi:hypothetical protein